MIKIGDKVLVGSSKVEGAVVEVEKTTGSVLVAHLITVDGKSKNVKQWYHENTVTEVSVAERKSGKTLAKALKELTEVEEMPADKHIEFGVLPQKSDSDGK